MNLYSFLLLSYILQIKIELRSFAFLFSMPSVRFLTRYDGEVSEPLVGRQGSRVSMRVARGSASLLPSRGRGGPPGGCQ